MSLAAAPRLATGNRSWVNLPDHPTQSAFPINGWFAVLFGVPFFAPGAWVTLVAFGVVHGVSYAPAWLIAIVGLLFFCVGLWLLIHGLHGVMVKARYTRGKAQHPGQPWLYDFLWRQDGIIYSAFKAMLGRLLAALFWTGMLAPFFWICLNLSGGWFFLVAVPILFSAAGFIFWYRWAVALVRLMRHGNSFLRYDSFPYLLGGALRARLRAPRHVTDLDALALTLRCVQEQYVTTGGGEDRTSRVVCYELYKDAVAFTRDHLAHFSGAEIPIEFSLPADQPPTSLAATPPRYWEIEVRGSSRKISYMAYFLVPVYGTSYSALH